MPRGNPSPKLAVTIDPEVYAGLVEAAKADHKSLSAWVTSAIRHQLKVRAGLAGVAEWEAENGPITEEEAAEAHRSLVADGLFPADSRP